jgi:predicted house-cleaning noncanonical NTP pyrophosphatase (MazG superfamily)
MPKFIFNKLVRNKLREEYMRMHQAAEYRKLSKSELSHELANKIIEEIKEIPIDGTNEEITAELADAKQAMDDLMQLHGITSDAVAKTQKMKFEKKGGFSEGTFVVSLELNDDDEWVDYYRASPDIFAEVGGEDLVLDVPLIEAGVYEHYKGKRYEVIGVGLDSETTKPVVVYVPLYESNVPFWVRPYEMFLEFVEVDGTKVRRFEKIND